MRKILQPLLLAASLVACLTWSSSLGAADVLVRVITHPSRAQPLTVADVRAIFLKQKLFWDDGAPIIPINREAGSEARELFSERVFGRSPRRLATYWNQRYFEAGEFPPATLASQEAVLRFVSKNSNAIGYVTGEETSDSVAVVLVLK